MNKTPVLFTVFLSAAILSCNINLPEKSDSKEAYFINAEAGNDKNPGNVRRPLKTISEVNKRVMTNPGSIFLTGGQVFEGAILLNDIKGSDSIPFVVSSYGQGRAIINGGNNESIRIKNCKNIHINNLDLKGNGRKDGNTTNGLQLFKSTNCVVEDIHAEGFQKSGVDLYNCKDVKVLNVVAFGNGFCGINIMGSHQDSSGNILIRDCKAENNAGDPTILDNHSGNGILVGVSDSVIIDHCTATNNGWDMPRQGNGPVGIWTWQSDHVTIQYCISYRNRTSRGGKDGGGFDLDGGVTNSLIQYCLSYENEGAGYGLFQYSGASDWSDNVIRYCLSINDAQTTEGAASFFIWNGSDESRQLTNCYIYNNVAYSTSAPVISYENASEHENFVFCNNIFIGTGQMIPGRNSGSSYTNNIWTTASDTVLQGPFVPHITDPYKLNTLTGFMLPSASKIKDSGIQIRSMYGFDPPSNDFFGNPCPQGSAPEPGIHELE